MEFTLSAAQKKLSLIIGTIALIVTGVGYISGGFDSLLGYAEREKNEDLMYEFFIQYQEDLPAFLALPNQINALTDSISAMKTEMQENRFVASQVLEMLFGELELVTEHDGAWNIYYFWENFAGDYWIVVNGVPYIVQYQSAKGYWYYVHYPDGKHIKVEPSAQGAPPTYNLQYEDEALEELEAW